MNLKQFTDKFTVPPPPEKVDPKKAKETGKKDAKGKGAAVEETPKIVHPSLGVSPLQLHDRFVSPKKKVTYSVQDLYAIIHVALMHENTRDGARTFFKRLLTLSLDATESLESVVQAPPPEGGEEKYSPITRKKFIKAMTAFIVEERQKAVQAVASRVRAPLLLHGRGVLVACLRSRAFASSI